MNRRISKLSTRVLMPLALVSVIALFVASGLADANGLSSADNQFWTQGVGALGSEAQQGEKTGYSVASGDFDGDGYDDLAVGEIGEDVVPDGGGAVSVVYGTAAGLTGQRAQVWNQDVPGIVDMAEPLDSFGYALASGDFNNDGYDDLAIGVPNEGEGAVAIIYGSVDGLTAAGNQLMDDGNSGLPLQGGAQFGWSLDSGDFNGDGYDDLAVGAPGWDLNDTVHNAGAAYVLYGSISGITEEGSQGLTQGITGIEQKGCQCLGAESFDEFGYAVAAGDFNNDGYDDLAIGAPYEDLPDGGSGADSAGAVTVRPGSPSGLEFDAFPLWNQDYPGIVGGAEPDDNFGFALAAGDVNNDGYDDLAIGVPGEDLGDGFDQGAFQRLFGSTDGVTADANQLYGQPNGEVENGDEFGRALATGNFDDEPADEVVAGVPFEGLPGAAGVGAVQIVFATGGTQVWNQDSPDILDQAEISDHFGWALAVGDFDGNGGDDLAVGVPDEDLGALIDAGAVNVIYSGKPPAATDTPTPTSTPTHTPTSAPPTATNTPPPGATAMPTSQGSGLVGDVDCSGTVNPIDAAYMLQLVTLLLNQLPCPQNADTNGDGQANTIDAALILQYSAGLLATLPP